MSSLIESLDLVLESDIQNYCGYIENLIQQDEGKRGIKTLIQPEGELYFAAKELIAANRIAILTGFPCMIDNIPPTETDGPLGALSIARALLKIGKEVIILTDECNEDVVLSCCAAADLPMTDRSRLNLQSFPARSQMNDSDVRRLGSISDEIDFLVAIERSGPNSEGKYLTMR